MHSTNMTIDNTQNKHCN